MCWLLCQQISHMLSYKILIKFFWRLSYHFKMIEQKSTEDKSLYLVITRLGLFIYFLQIRCLKWKIISNLPIVSTCYSFLVIVMPFCPSGKILLILLFWLLFFLKYFLLQTLYLIRLFRTWSLWLSILFILVQQISLKNDCPLWTKICSKQSLPIRSFQGNELLWQKFQQKPCARAKL